MGCQIGMIFNDKITLKSIENSWKLKKKLTKVKKDIKLKQWWI